MIFFKQLEIFFESSEIFSSFFEVQRFFKIIFRREKFFLNFRKFWKFTKFRELKKIFLSAKNFFFNILSRFFEKLSEVYKIFLDSKKIFFQLSEIFSNFWEFRYFFKIIFAREIFFWILEIPSVFEFSKNIFGGNFRNSKFRFF